MSLVALAVAAAEVAGKYLAGVQRPSDPDRWTSKGPGDWVTDIDRTAEGLISDILLKGEPGSSIVGEELTPGAVAGAGLVWIVDPLDGTTNFLHGLPHFAVSIAAAVDGRLEAGCVLHVSQWRMLHAERGRGAWNGSDRLRVSAISDARHALIATGFPFKDFDALAEYQSQFAAVAPGTSGIRRAGAAALDLADTAAGRYDGFWEQHLSAWDVAAGMLLIREAGGVVTDLQGRELGVEHGSVVAGNPAVHAWMLKRLAGAPSIPN
ncbi:MAG: inositol monophosphatase family protein [Gemmatimonadota bacterium]